MTWPSHGMASPYTAHQLLLKPGHHIPKMQEADPHFTEAGRPDNSREPKSAWPLWSLDKEVSCGHNFSLLRAQEANGGHKWSQTIKRVEITSLPGLKLFFLCAEEPQEQGEYGSAGLGPLEFPEATNENAPSRHSTSNDHEWAHLSTKWPPHPPPAQFLCLGPEVLVFLSLSKLWWTVTCAFGKPRTRNKCTLFNQYVLDPRSQRVRETLQCSESVVSKFGLTLKKEKYNMTTTLSWDPSSAW